MMLGGGLMMGIGLIVLLAIIGLTVLSVVVIAGGTAGFLFKRNEVMVGDQQPVTKESSNFIQPDRAIAVSKRYCSHCGAGLQTDWSHCPQCGASIS